ncbi:MAG: iron-containing redox enzyme family protein [Chloroflexi bacterium]|nr:iron-containing redox enzyme family protein [Chloroflexota bacterium]
MAVQTALSPREFVERFKAEIAAHPKLRVNHPFVRGIQAGTISREHLLEWVRQDYKFRNAVPRLAMLRYLACSDPEIARRLYEVVEEETAGLATGSAGHIDLFVRFAAALGLSREELDAAPLAPATAAHLYYAELIIHTRPWFVVMAAQMAAEGTAPAAMAALADGLIKHYGLAPDDVAFFTVHVDADEDHGSLAEEIAERYLQSPALQAETREVGLRRLELLYDTWTIPGY